MWARLNGSNGNLPSEFSQLRCAGGAALSVTRRLCGRDFSLCQTLANFGFSSPGVKLGKIHVEAEIVFQQHNFWVLKEQGQRSQTLVFQRELAKSPWLAMGLQCNMWESAGADRFEALKWRAHFRRLLKILLQESTKKNQWLISTQMGLAWE